jgi:hypothetical protein
MSKARSSVPFRPPATRSWLGVLICAFAFGSFSCSDSNPAPGNGSPPVSDAAAETSVDVVQVDVVEDVPFADSGDSSRVDAGDNGDATSDAATDVSRDRSSDTAIDRSIDATEADHASDRLIDQSVDGASVDAVDEPAGDAPPADQSTSDSDAPPLSATCTMDQPCVNGNCQGSSCDKAWYCFAHLAPHPCPLDRIIPYCGCDGKTYYFPLSCPETPYEHAGECGDGVNCDPNDVRCVQPEPDCGPGKVASVVAGCYGPCVPINSCRCLFAFECPHLELNDCNADQRCDPY